MIDTQLLKNYLGRALGCAVYGNGGLEKTLAVRTLPPPVLLLDFEGGSGPLGPWIRRVKKWNDQAWMEYADQDRETLFQLVPAEKRTARAILKPAPYIDVISFDVMSQETVDGRLASPAYDSMFNLVTNLNCKAYNSVAIDPLLEFSQLTQTKSKIVKRVSALEPMDVSLWTGAQERAAILLRVLREYRDKGMFIYMTSSEFVDKDYGDKDPRSTQRGEKPEEPYAIKGTFNVPGKLVAAVNHMIDLQFHARMLNGVPCWVTREEPARSGSFNWEAKDRTGRLADQYIQPNMRSVIRAVYGEEAFKAIYAQREVAA